MSQFCNSTEAKIEKQPSLTDNAEREFSHPTEFADERCRFIASIVYSQPIEWTVFGTRADFSHRTGHYIFTSVKMRSNNIYTIKVSHLCVFLHSTFTNPAT